MVPESWDLQNVKILSFVLTMALVPFFQHTSFPNCGLLEKKRFKCSQLAKIMADIYERVQEFL